MSIEIDDACKLRIVACSTLARTATPATQGALVRAGTLRRVGRDERMFRHGEPAVDIVLVGAGHVRLWRPVTGGSARVTGYRSAGEVAGEAALGDGAIHDESAEGMTVTEALCVPRGVVLELVARDAALNAAVLRLLVARHQAAQEQIGALLRDSVERRLAAFLLAAAARWGVPEPRGVRVAASLTHAELASLLGSTRETVTLTLGNLRRAGAIALDRRQVIILRRDALEEAAGGTRSPRGGSRLAGATGDG
jgi:CRP-like cAMP-binding protein